MNFLYIGLPSFLWPGKWEEMYRSVTKLAVMHTLTLVGGAVNLNLFNVVRSCYGKYLQ